jgi:pimeloyl-ACP methyl ester carboxylesterase
MGNILANGIRIWYEEQGKGPAMLWAHGLGGTWHDWDETMAFFQKRYRVIAYDARGHGHSEVPDSPEAYSQDIMVQDMRGIMDALGISQAVVGGHSMGANVALNFALQYPTRCLGLIPVGIGSGSTNREWYQAWHDKLADLAEKKGMAAFLAEMKNLPAWRSALSHPKIGKQIRQTVLNNSPKAIAYTIRGVQKKRPTIFELGPRLEHLDVATLVVFSESDTLVTDCSRFMVQSMPRATLALIPSKSHWVHLENPQIFLGSVERFLSSLPGLPRL